MKSFFAWVIIIALFLLSCIFYAQHWLNTPLTMPTPTAIRVEKGENLSQIVKNLNAKGVRAPLLPMLILARIKMLDQKIKAGDYVLKEALTPLALLTTLTQGAPLKQMSIFFAEGLTFNQWKNKIKGNSFIINDLNKETEEAIAKQLNLPTLNLEGWLFPETYFVDAESKASVLLRRAARAMQKVLEDEWLLRANDLPYQNPYEALIMASIIEKETAKEDERALVAAVFVNRLKRKMKLQTDPTVIYGLGEKFNGNLRKVDLENDTPFNTYTRFGLPPSPIAMPGKKSIHAALNPAQSEVLYFVAKGDGSSHFSTTLQEHNRAVDFYQRKRGSPP